MLEENSKEDLMQNRCVFYLFNNFYHKTIDIQCRYQYLKAKQSREVKWAAREDEALAKKVTEMVDKIIWLEVAEHLAKLKHTSTIRTALECKER